MVGIASCAILPRIRPFALRSPTTAVLLAALSFGTVAFADGPPDAGVATPDTSYPLELSDRPLTLPRGAVSASFAVGLGATSGGGRAAQGVGPALDFVVRGGVTDRLEILFPLLVTWSFHRDDPAGTEWALTGGAVGYSIFQPVDFFPAVGLVHRRQTPGYAGLRARLRLRSTTPVRFAALSGALDGSVTAVHTFGEVLTLGVGAAATLSQPRPLGSPNPFEAAVTLGSTQDAPLLTWHAGRIADLFLSAEVTPSRFRVDYRAQLGIQVFLNADRKPRSERPVLRE